MSLIIILHMLPANKSLNMKGNSHVGMNCVQRSTGRRAAVTSRRNAAVQNPLCCARIWTSTFATVWPQWPRKNCYTRGRLRQSRPDLRKGLLMAPMPNAHGE